MNENLQNLSISQIAALIRKDWKNPYFGAKPYLDAMFGLETINDNYGCDSGFGIVSYFLANASQWKGDLARNVKKELKRRLGD